MTIRIFFHVVAHPNPHYFDLRTAGSHMDSNDKNIAVKALFGINSCRFGWETKFGKFPH